MPEKAKQLAPATTRPFRVGMVGNPNAGKTTLFNQLTGLRHKVANYPGVTVEHKVGRLSGTTARAIDLVDLPGTYSLAAHSPDEMIVVDVLLGHQPGCEAPDAILAIVDASNLERNLYLVSQLLDFGRPLLLALNMTDVASSRGLDIDVEVLSARLGVPVVAVQAHRGHGVPELVAALQHLSENGILPAPAEPYAWPEEIETRLEQLQGAVGDALDRKLGWPVHRFEWARTLIDEGGYAEKRALEAGGPTLREALANARGPDGKTPLSAVETQSRYRWIRSITQKAVTRGEATAVNWTEQIDRVLTHRVLGSLVFAGAMLLLFQSIFTWSGPFMDAISDAFEFLGTWLAARLPEGALSSLICDGIIAGVGAVLVFLPQIVLLFLFLAILEDCGYMARAAFLMDRLMFRCGLSGKSFIPMLSGFACAVPAVMAARVVENPRDRLATILVTPLMACSARLPVYTILIAAFVPAQEGPLGLIGLPALTMLSLYVLGIVVALVMASLFKRTLLAGPTPAFVLELPTYKWPAPRSVGRRLFHASSAFIRRAGTMILAVTVVVWALAYFPRMEAPADATTPPTHAEAVTSNEAARAALQLEQSLLGQMGHAVEPVFRPLGWDWRISVATLASFPAREVIVATLGTLFSLGSDVDEESGDLQAALRNATHADGRPLFTIPVALSLLVFFALCCQCAATIATIRRETNSWGWAWFTFGYMTVLAYVGALATFRVGSLF